MEYLKKQIELIELKEIELKQILNWNDNDK